MMPNRQICHEVAPNTPVKSPFAICCFAAVLNAALMFVLFLWMANTRNLDGDEGLYLEAARLVAQGKRLYLDFFFQQMPLTPYLYAGWMKLFGFTLISSRYLSALMISLTSLSVLLYTVRKTQTLWIINLIALLFFANGMILAWAPVVKTHPLAMLALTGSCVALLEWRRNQRSWLLLVAALLIGIGVNGRLTLGPVLVYYLGFVLLFSRRRRWTNGFLFTLTVAATSIPTFYYFFSDPALFIQYNFRYHTQVYPGVVNAMRRMYTAQNLMRQWQLLLLVVGAQGTLLLLTRKKWREFWASDEVFILFLCVLFIAIHMASAEPYTQYFVALIPLLILLVIPLLQKVQTMPKWVGVPVTIVAMMVYLLNARVSMDFEVASMLSDRPEWKISNVMRVAGKVRKVRKKGEPCLTWWPGFAFIVGCDSVPGMENHMRNYAVQRLLREEVLSYKMLPDEDLLKALQERKYQVIIDNLYHIDSPYYEELRMAMAKNYWSVGQGVKVRAPEWFGALADKN